MDLSGYTRDQLDYHRDLMIREGLASGGSTPVTGDSFPIVTLSSLTPAGHDFLDRIRQAGIAAAGHSGPSQLADKLAASFNKEELKALCHGLEIRYEDLPAETRIGIAMELEDYMQRRGRLHELLALCRRERPHVDWP